MLKIKRLEFNDFGVNTYIISDESGACVIIDAACYSKAENDELDAYLHENGLKPLHLLNTHCHVDHILGNAYVEDTWHIGLEIHPDSDELLRMGVGYASVFGFDLERIVKASSYLNEGDKVIFGSGILDILHTPGHAPGSLCFVSHSEKAVFTGDVLFSGSVGRTDLPGGNMDTLLHSIKVKLMVLDDDYKVFPGHGPASTIGNERVANPFLQ